MSGLAPILLAVCVLAALGVLAGMHVLSRSESTGASRLWSWAWSCLLVVAGLAVSGRPGLEPWARLFAAPAPLLLLAGSLAFVGRRVPHALLAAAPLAGLASAAGALAGLPAPRAWAAGFGAVEGLAALVLWRGRSPAAGWPERVLPLAMALYAGTHAGLVGSSSELRLSMPLVAAHIASVLLLLTAQALGLQERMRAAAARTSAALHESEQRYRALTENAGVVVICLDRRHRILEWNATAEQVYGWRREEALGLDYFEHFLPEEHREPIAREIEQILTGRPTVGYVNPVLRRDGSERILRWDVTRLVDESGTAYGILCLAHDITEERRRDAEQRRLVAAAEQAGDGITLADRERRIVYANPAFASMMERPMAELIGQPLSSLAHDWNPEELIPEIVRSWGRGEGFQHRYVATRPDGRRFERHATVAPVRDEEGEIAWTVIVVRDVTREAALEAELQRTEKLSALGTLAVGIAHDFNNLLTAVIGGAHDLLEDPPSEETRLAGQTILEAAARGAALCRQLLAFGKRQPLQPEILEPGAVVRDLRGLLEHLIGEKVELELRAGAGPWRIWADRSQLEQVVMNLVRNASDAMPGGGRLTVTTGGRRLEADDPERPAELAPGDYLWLEVEDEGEGMDAETRARAFEPFFTRKPAGKGTGLGLATVYGIARQSGGDVRIESEPGRGSRVRVYLPRAGEAPAPAAAPPAARAGGAGTILLVEDDVLVRRVAERTLDGLGYRVLAAASGEEALARAAEAQEIDLLVSDVVMPGLCGAELARRLRATRPGTRVLFISGYPGGANGPPPDLSAGRVLRKPFTPEELAEEVRRTLA